jgi:CBS domain-containing protein
VSRRETLLKDVMITDVVTIDAAATLLDAARTMRDANLGMLPVVEGQRLCGIITDRDLVVRGMAEGVEPGAVPVRECLTANVTTADPEWSVDRAMRAMATEKIGRLPVVGDHARVVGVVTLSSLVLRSREREEALETAKEVSRRSARRIAAG